MATISERIAAGTDDAYDTADGLGIGYSDSANEVNAGHDGTREVVAGFRWEIEIPAGATIDSAFITLTELGFPGGNISVTIKCQDGSSAPATFSSGSSPVDRTNTTEGVDWSITEGVPGATHKSPDFKAVVQEVVDDHGPISALVVLLRNNGSATTNGFTSYNSSPSASALLEIEYTEAAAAGVSVHQLRRRAKFF